MPTGQWFEFGRQVEAADGFGSLLLPFAFFSVGFVGRSGRGQGRAVFARRSAPLTARTGRGLESTVGPGAGSSLRNGAPTGAMATVTSLAGIPVSLRPVCPWPVSTYP